MSNDSETDGEKVPARRRFAGWRNLLRRDSADPADANAELYFGPSVVPKDESAVEPHVIITSTPERVGAAPEPPPKLKIETPAGVEPHDLAWLYTETTVGNPVTTPKPGEAPPRRGIAAPQTPPEPIERDLDRTEVVIAPSEPELENQVEINVGPTDAGLDRSVTTTAATWPEVDAAGAVEAEAAKAPLTGPDAGEHPVRACDPAAERAMAAETIELVPIEPPGSFDLFPAPVEHTAEPEVALAPEATPDATLDDRNRAPEKVAPGGRTWERLRKVRIPGLARRSNPPPVRPSPTVDVAPVPGPPADAESTSEAPRVDEIANALGTDRVDAVMPVFDTERVDAVPPMLDSESSNTAPPAFDAERVDEIEPTSEVGRVDVMAPISDYDAGADALPIEVATAESGSDIGANADGENAGQVDASADGEDAGQVDASADPTADKSLRIERLVEQANADTAIDERVDLEITPDDEVLLFPIPAEDVNDDRAPLQLIRARTPRSNALTLTPARLDPAAFPYHAPKRRFSGLRNPAVYVLLVAVIALAAIAVNAPNGYRYERYVGPPLKDGARFTFRYPAGWRGTGIVQALDGTIGVGFYRRLDDWERFWRWVGAPARTPEGRVSVQEYPAPADAAVLDGRQEYAVVAAGRFEHVVQLNYRSTRRYYVMRLAVPESDKADYNAVEPVVVGSFTIIRPGVAPPN